MSESELAAGRNGATALPLPDDSALAPWSLRVYAKLIDTSLIWIPFTILWILGDYYAASGNAALSNGFYLAATVEGVIGWGWVIYQTGATGQSLGKRLIGTRSVGKDGQPVGFWHSLLHETVSLFVDMIPLLIGYLWPLIDKKRQTFSDKILNVYTYRV